MAWSYLASKDFWLATLERAVRTACQAVLGTGALDVVSATAQVSLLQLLVVAGFAAVAAVLTCVAAGRVTDSPSFTRAESLTDERPR